MGGRKNQHSPGPKIDSHPDSVVWGLSARSQEVGFLSQPHQWPPVYGPVLPQASVSTLNGGWGVLSSQF